MIYESKSRTVEYKMYEFEKDDKSDLTTNSKDLISASLNCLEINKLKKTRFNAAFIISVAIAIIVIGYLTLFKPWIDDSKQLDKVNKEKSKATVSIQSPYSTKVDKTNGVTDLGTPQQCSVYLNNIDSEVKEVFVFYNNNNKNDIMVSAFDKVLNAISNHNVKYSKEGDKIVFSNGNLKLTFEVNSDEYISTKQNGKMRHPVEQIEETIYYPLSE
jgi:hypothetical protein